jgi:hypothetical protein
MRAGLAGGVLAAALALGACGYGFSQRYVARDGAERVVVRPFENASTEPELGAAVTSALRAALARRGADAGEGAPAVLEGEIRAGEPVPTSSRGAATATWRIAVEVRARLVGRDGVSAEHVARREIDYLSGADPLETEGRRAVALRRLLDDAAEEILRAFER